MAPTPEYDPFPGGSEMADLMRRHTGKGGLVQVRLRRVSSQVEITVSDTGEGIAPGFLPHLFMRFSQADTTFARTHGGLGLGLTICRHLVEAHGGHIEAHSPGKGQGTTVRVELPLMIVHDAKIGASDSIPTPKKRRSRSRR